MAATLDPVGATAMVPDPPERADATMSVADRAHWEQVLCWRARVLPEPTATGRLGRWLVDAGARLLPTTGTDSLVGTAAGLVTGVLGDAGDVLEAVGVVAVTERLGDLGHELGRAGLDAAGVVATYRRAGHDVGELADVATLEVDDVLAARPALARTYVALAAATGGAFALVPGLGTVLDRCGASLPGVAGLLGLAAGAGVDAVLTAATCTRAVTLTGAYYGYDPAGPDEQAVALAVLSVSLSDGQAKHSAERLLRALQEGQSPPAGLSGEVTAGLRAHLRRRGLAHATPVLGVALAALGSGRLLARVLDDADHLYRERFLRERYGPAPEPHAA